MEIKRIVEAILFSSSRPISLRKMQEITGKSREEILKIIEELRREYEHRSFQIMEIAGGFCLYTKPEYSEYVKKVKGDKKLRLSKSAMETLAIIAYKQPITKAEINKIKKISCDWTIKVLIEKGLVKPIGRLNLPGKPFLYGTTQKFLEIFGLKSLDELPKPE